MADRYVNYDKLLEERHRLGLDEMSMVSKVNAFNLFIDRLPTADVVKVKHGEWERVIKNGRPRGIKCSLCGKHIYFHENYCPKCGAKMDGGKAE